MPEAEWVAKASKHMQKFVPEIHPDDVHRLAEDLHKTWGPLGPKAAVSYFFRPLKPGSGATELS